jgi:hypothetical protein
MRRGMGLKELRQRDRLYRQRAQKFEPESTWWVTKILGASERVPTVVRSMQLMHATSVECRRDWIMLFGKGNK